MGGSGFARRGLAIGCGSGVQGGGWLGHVGAACGVDCWSLVFQRSSIYDKKQLQIVLQLFFICQVDNKRPLQVEAIVSLQ